MWWLLLLFVIAVVVVLWREDTRRYLISRPVMRAMAGVMPGMSQTERDALEAGTVWWEGELFSGRPDWDRLLSLPWPELTREERDFLAEDTTELCRMVDDWESTRQLDMPPEVWAFIRQRGFFSLIIPKEYGGKGFSALAHSEVITLLATRSSAPAVTVMVPNSLGPAELLLHYGTDEQKHYWLPRLAAGDEVPAFALTSPWAGSDAASIPDAGVVCKGEWNGEEVLGMRVSFNKRYITLAPVCTVFGLAFHLYDPDHLLGEEEELGITVALVPRDHPGVEIGRRHLPLDAIWMNGPLSGKNVFMPLEFIIGGPERAGQGWRMLMECLATGRSISLPGANTGTQKLTARAVGAYARVRRQFRTPIGHFEGVEEALAKVAVNTYICDSARMFTVGALDLGERPSVVSAIVKYHVTERARESLNAGMDVLGGKGICLGPRNFLGRSFQQIPIGITVEGANILTRGLILFGQGAIRCHPFLLAEMQAVQARDEAAFHDAFSAHLRHSVVNFLRSLGIGLSAARFVRAPQRAAPATQRHYQRLAQFSVAFAIAADVCLLTLGGSLKRRERLSARLGDVLSQLYLASAVLRRFEADGRPAADLPLLDLAITDCLWRAQEAFDGLFANLPNRPLACVLRFFCFPLGRPASPPRDKLDHAAAKVLLEPSETRDRLTLPVFTPENEDEIVGTLEAALAAVIATEPLEARLRLAVREKRFKPPFSREGDVNAIWRHAHVAGIIDDEELTLIERRNTLCDKVIHVDDFPVDFELRANLCSVDTTG
ncbi:MAG TPA: acyl-CoA dehydrogenase [Azoarcus sp.]|nr:acyl-CoA dehydrogenase [Azoarcus sp.]